tara:strand:+ start:2589 stop:2918 length:330 start_codon:yes stop_codon:yes gene_type:complete
VLLEIVEKELKIFYFKAFKRRSKSLETLDLIQECYSDQISLFNEYLERLLKSFKEKRTKSLLIEDLIKFKNLEGCNKKIMKSLIAEIKKIDHSINFDSVENKYLFEFDD